MSRDKWVPISGDELDDWLSTEPPKPEPYLLSATREGVAEDHVVLEMRLPVTDHEMQCIAKAVEQVMRREVPRR